jgi:hypothetical protein
MQSDGMNNKMNMINFDHIFLFSNHVEKLASFMSEILALPPAQPCGPDLDVLRLDIADAGALQYHYHANSIPI